MLNETLEQSRELRLAGMAAALEEQLTHSASTTLGFEERLARQRQTWTIHRTAPTAPCPQSSP